MLSSAACRMVDGQDLAPWALQCATSEELRGLEWSGTSSVYGLGFKSLRFRVQEF